MLVDVQFQKWGELPHWRFRLPLLGEDRFGTWLAGVPPVEYTRPGVSVTFGHRHVVLIPRAGWWAAVWHEIGNTWTDIELYVDITTPARWYGRDRVVIIDLDLDVVRDRDGRVAVLDEDEFDEHREQLAYPPEIVDGARRSAAEVVSALRVRREPFGRVSMGWLALVGSR